jgi:hypothetical protein
LPDEGAMGCMGTLTAGTWAWGGEKGGAWRRRRTLFSL